MSADGYLALGAMPALATPDKWRCAGPFCFCGQEENFPDWEKNFTFAPEPLAHAEILAQAARMAQSLCLAVIPGLAYELDPGNSAHRPEYWQIILCPWTMDLARQLVERVLRCEAMTRVWGSLNLKVSLLPENCRFTFSDEHDFTLRGNLGEKFNHWLFSRILENIWPPSWEKDYLPEYDDRMESGKKRLPYGAKIKNLIRRYLLYLPFPRLKGMSLVQAGLYSNALRHPLKSEAAALDLEKIYYKAELLRKLALPENYEGIFTRFLPQSIRALKHEKIRQKKAKKPYLRVVSPVAYEDAVYRQELASWREEGNALAWVQHGGNYGQVRTSCEAELIEYSQNFFFTWGWDKYENVRGNFIPMPYPQLANIANAWEGKEEKIIFTGAEMATYGYRLDSHPTPLQFVEYRQWKADFLSALPAELLGKIWYRPYFSLPGTLIDAQWLLPRFPQINLCTGELMPQILNCRLLVLDHHGTTLLEGMAANVPMLLYWNRKNWLLSPACEKLVDMLELCGVWHPNPESAAKKLMEIWPDTEKWWRSQEITEARKIFCEHQARLPGESLNKVWVRTLKDL